MTQAGTFSFSYDTNAGNLFQYNNAPILQSLLSAEATFYQQNVGVFFEDWLTDVLNIDTANTFGLEVWGKILGVPRPYQVPENYHVNRRGQFELYNTESGTFHEFWLIGQDNPAIYLDAGHGVDSQSFVDDETYRLFLKGRMFLYNSNGSVYDINRYLSLIFPDRPIYVLNGYDMTVSVVFFYTPSLRDLALINSPDFLPLPTGVESNVAITSFDYTFGFEGSGLLGFNQGVFFR